MQTTMPPRKETIGRAARKLMLDRSDLENVAIAGFGLAIFFQVAGMVLVRLVKFLLMPVLVLVLYPATRAEDRRRAEQAHQDAMAGARHRAAQSGGQ